MLQSKRPRFGRNGTRAKNLDRVALPGGTVQDGLSVRCKSSRADIATPKCDLVISRVRHLNPPKSFSGDQSSSRSQQKSEANQGRGEFIRSARRRCGIVMSNSDG